MAKKTLFEKMGLVEKVSDDFDDTETYLDEEETVAEEPEVNVEGVKQDNLIADIYSANDMTNFDTSIFKAEEIKATLPATMTTEAMQATVTGILGSFKLTVDELDKDGQRRNEILQAARNKTVEENTNEIDDLKNKIEDAKHLIENCEKEIADHEKVISSSTETINAEIMRIDNLRTFLGGK